jgi:hypothetical protein
MLSLFIIIIFVFFNPSGDTIHKYIHYVIPYFTERLLNQPTTRDPIIA